MNDVLKDTASHKRKPSKHDLVLGGNNAPPTYGLVLGGIEGIKHRFSQTNGNNDKIAILKEALVYSDEGENFLFEIVSTEINKLQWFAAVSLLETKQERYKKKILYYFTEFLKENKNNLKWNLWRKEFPYLRLSLKNINLSDLRLIGFNFSKIDFSGANFTNARLIDIDLKEANLSNTKFNNVKLYSCDFSNTNLKHVDFSGAIFNEVNFRRANFKRAKIDELDFRGTDIRDANFSLTDRINTNFKGASLKGAKFNKSRPK